MVIMERDLKYKADTWDAETANSCLSYLED